MVESFGGYEVVARVAQGSTGVVYRARHLDLGRDAALKVLSPELRGVPGQLERMRSEAALLAGLDDPHIVEVYDFVEEPDRVWIAEQWVEGASLERILGTHGRLGPEQALGAVRGALMGLAYAHDRGLVHRDFSTGNVLADLAGTSMLVDFGLAAPVGGGGALGTPAFLSPEVVAGQPAGKTSDVYSAAAVTFTLLTGRPPFPGSDVAAVLRAHVETPAPLLEGFGGDLQDVLRRAMDKDPARRPADAAALLAELESAARRRFGAGWLDRASIAGVVGSVVGAGALAVGSAGAAGVVAGPVAETVVVDTGTLGGGGTGAVTPTAGKGVAKVANRSRMLLAVGSAAVLFVVGGVALAVTHANNGPSSGRPSTTDAANASTAASPSTTPKPTKNTTITTTPSAAAAGDVPAAAAFSGVYDVTPGLNGVIDGVRRVSGATTWTVKPQCSSGACAVGISFSNGGHATYAYVNGGWRYQFKDKSGCQHGVLTITLVPGKTQMEAGVLVLGRLSGTAINHTRACAGFSAISDVAHETFVRRAGS